MKVPTKRVVKKVTMRQQLRLSTVPATVVIMLWRAPKSLATVLQMTLGTRNRKKTSVMTDRTSGVVVVASVLIGRLGAVGVC